MNKKALTETDIRTKFITPALVGVNGEKWNVMTQIREEAYFTKGRVIVRRKTVKRGEAKKADYLLYYKPNVPLAVLEAKDNNHAVGDGMQQALESLPLQLVMIPKASNSAGLQLTDLMARPVTLKHLRPQQPNRAYDIIETKFRRSPAGKIEGWGLKLLP